MHTTPPCASQAIKHTKITIEVDVNLKDQLDLAATQCHGPPARPVREALSQFLDHDAWFHAEVEAGLREADAGDFLTPDEKAAAHKRWTE